jgi:hypothetical protein
MVNFGLNTASFLGIILAIAGAGLYFLRSFRPELSRDQDIAFTAIGIICGFILIFQGWRLDPILQFGQLLLSGSTIFFAYENIKLRGITTEQAKGKTQIVDDDRPVSRRYKAEIEDRDYLERPRNGRRIRGEDGRRSNEQDEREDIPQRRVARQLPEEDRYAESPPRRRRSPSDSGALGRRPSSARTSSYDEQWDQDNDEDWNDPTPKKPRRALPEADRDLEQPARRSARRDTPPDRERTSRRDDNPDEGAPPRRRRPRPDDNPPSTMVASRAEIGANEGTTASYVDYEPVNPESGLPPSGTEEPIVFPDRY